MNEEKVFRLLNNVISAYRQKKSTTKIALICAAAWLGTVMIIGKSALLPAIPLTLIALVREADR